MSISQLTISYLQEVSTATQERAEFPCTKKTVTVLEKLVAEVMAPTVTNPPCLCGHHLCENSHRPLRMEAELFLTLFFMSHLKGKE